jgi:hypothetical protein
MTDAPSRAVALALALLALPMLPACGGGGGGPSTSTLTVSRSGPIGGVITSEPVGIACGSTCQYAFENGAVVTLTVAVNDGNATFTGWSGGTCTGTGTCVVTLDAAKTVTAAFEWTTAGADPWKAQNADRQPLDLTPYVAFSAGAGRFALVAGGEAAPLVVSTAVEGEYPGVVRAVSTLQGDVLKVSGVQPAVASAVTAGTLPVLIGTLGHSPIIDGLVTAGKIDVTELSGKWETWHTQIVTAPMDGVASALVIAGSDQRGTIFGVYDLSRQMGISPWYFWDDVAPAHNAEIYVLPGVHSLGQPAVKYRGFFINDESPALGTWVQNTYHTGTFNHLFYEQIFETMLRLRANYLWPAVWGKAFDLDDNPQNHATAKAYGIVMGTSHEAPMDRGIEEFKRRKFEFGGNGLWSFRTNADAITKYWTAGIQRMVTGGFEDVVTVGMRGDGDTALADGAALPLMESIISTERQVIASVTGQNPTTVPQVWTLYKEVQDYWDRGFRAPADVTINWCDDNWGNLRALPDLSDDERSGGYGVYYHFDYVGAARNYKWVDTNLLSNVWEQMNLAYTYGVDRLWMVNGGDVKGNERPIQFFLDLAWSPQTWTLANLEEWQTRFAEENFGAAYAADIAELMGRYERLQSRRKPELLNKLYTYSTPTNVGSPSGSTASAFSLVNYRELERVLEEWQQLREDTETLGALIPDQQATYYQLVEYPIVATENVYALRLAEFRNILYAAQGRASAVDWASEAQLRFKDPVGAKNPDDWSSDEDFSTIYNTIVAGKWNGFQSEAKLGYGGSYTDSDWQSPSGSQEVIWPPLVTPTLQSGPSMGVAVDGSTASSTGATTLNLPALDRYSTAPAPYIEVFNRGTGSFSYTITGAPAWLTISNASGTIDDALKEQRAEITVPSWGAVPAGTTSVSLAVAGNSQSVTVQLQVVNPTTTPVVGTFVEAGGYVSIQADHYTSAVTQGEVSWLRILDVGRADPGVRSAGMTPAPASAGRIASPGGETPRLEYDVHLYTTGSVTVWAYLSPRNNVLPSRYTTGEGLKYGISIDDGPVQVVNVTTQTNADDLTMNLGWQRNVADNVARTYSTHTIGSAGKHTVRFWMVDPTVILQKLVVDTGGLRASQLGPPESLFYDP